MERPLPSGPVHVKKLLVMALAFALALILVAGAELTARLFGPDESGFRFRTAFEHLTGEGQLEVHPTRFFTTSPNARVTPEHAGRYAVGSWPFRGRPPVTASSPTKRIVVLGDSCVYGLGLAPAETLPHRLEETLADRGWNPEAVQVLNYGVPGYTTVQINLLLEEILEENTPEVVVVYPAAWNDQGPAMGPTDLQLVQEGSPSPLVRLARESALLRMLRSRSSQDSGDTEAKRAAWDEVAQAWERGEPLHGTRVPSADLDAELHRLVDLCTEVGSELVLIAPAHPRSTAKRYPRTRRDAELVRTVAQDRGVPFVEAQHVLGASGLAEDELFMDYVHPTPKAVAALAAPVADRLLELLGTPPMVTPAGASAGAPTLSVEPRQVSVFGDVRVEIQLEPELARPIDVTVGGALLLDVQVAADGRVSGKLGANVPGWHDVVVQSGDGRVQWTPDALRLDLPELVLVDPTERRIQLRSRAGDRARVFLSRGSGRPRWAPEGVNRLDPARLLNEEHGIHELVCDEAGQAVLALDEVGDLPRNLWAQALVLPKGVPELRTLARWSTPLEVSRNESSREDE